MISVLGFQNDGVDMRDTKLPGLVYACAQCGRVFGEEMCALNRVNFSFLTFRWIRPANPNEFTTVEMKAYHHTRRYS